MNTTPFYDESTNPGNGWRVPDAQHAFSDMSDDLSALLPSAGQAKGPATTDRDGGKLFRDSCRKCAGTGRYRAPSSLGSACFACSGRGFNEYKTSPQQRADAKAKAVTRKNVRRSQEIADWRGQYPAEAAWIDAKDGFVNFATAMSNALAQYGSLTPGQTAAIGKFIKGDAERAVAKAAAVVVVAARTETVEAKALEEAFAKARESRLKWPKITLDKFTFKPAGPNSRNPGAIYVTQRVSAVGETYDGAYLGKVMLGAFAPSRDCTPELQAEIVAVMADPKKAAQAYGLRTGSCCICSRELTNKESIDLGIGPICAGRFGW